MQAPKEIYKQSLYCYRILSPPCHPRTHMRAHTHTHSPPLPFCRRQQKPPPQTFWALLPAEFQSNFAEVPHTETPVGLRPPGLPLALHSCSCSLPRSSFRLLSSRGIRRKKPPPPALTTGTWLVEPSHWHFWPFQASAGAAWGLVFLDPKGRPGGWGWGSAH